jgi:hypothetical protein
LSCASDGPASNIAANADRLADATKPIRRTDHADSRTPDISLSPIIDVMPGVTVVAAILSPDWLSSVAQVLRSSDAVAEAYCGTTEHPQRTS